MTHTLRMASLLGFGLFVVLFWSLPFGSFVGEDHTNQLLAHPNLKDEFSSLSNYTLQPSRPLSNLLTAAAHWVGGGEVWAHRLFSLFLHLGVAILFWMNLTLLNRRLERRFSEASIFFATVLFAIHPIHLETLLVSLYRWEITGSFFVLAAMYFAQRWAEVRENHWGVLCFVSFGLAVLCKEVFLLFGAVAIVLMAISGPRRPRYFWRVYGGSVFFWGALCGALLLSPTDHPLSMNFMKELSIVEYVRLSASAVAEHFWKVATGRGLSMMPIWHRPSLIWWMGLLGQAALLVGVPLVVGRSALKEPWVRVWGVLLLVSAYFYHAVPRNVGSERCLYFATLCLLALIPLLNERLQGMKNVLPVVAVLIFLQLSVVTFQRARQFSTEQGFSLGVLERAPLAGLGRGGLLNVWLTRTDPAHTSDYHQLPKTEDLAEVAKRIHSERKKAPLLAASLIDGILDLPLKPALRSRVEQAIQ